MKFKSFVIAVILLFGFTVKVSSQDAKVIVIDPQDAKKASTLYAEKLAADKEWDDFVKRTARKYTEGRNDGMSTLIYVLSPGKDADSWLARDGWQNGIQFSSDFKAIIPADYKPPACKQNNPFLGQFVNTTTTTGGSLAGPCEGKVTVGGTCYVQ